MKLDQMDASSFATEVTRSQIRVRRQMMLGELIERLEELGQTAVNIGNHHSYRGYYHHVALESDGERPAFELAAELTDAIGTKMSGYKGGEFEINTTLPVWIAAYGCCGHALLWIEEDGRIVTQDEGLLY